MLVKALPQPSKTYGETVCCAGVTIEGQWKRLYPIRYRHLSGNSAFSRWDFVSFQYRQPKSDRRVESCHVYEDSIVVDGHLRREERTRVLEPLIVPSAADAASRGQSLALVRPRNSRFTARPLSKLEIQQQRDSFKAAARQKSFFDKELADIEPSPYRFYFTFEDASGEHTYQNGDWEAHAMYWREQARSNSAEALKWMDYTFNVEYPKRGMVFALGNMAKRPQTWQLLGVLRLDVPTQGELAL